MDESALNFFWNQYLEAPIESRPKIASDAADILGQQGNRIAREGFLRQSIGDAIRTGDRRIAVASSVALASCLSEEKQFQEAERVLIKMLNQTEPWFDFELGLLFRELAWTYKDMEQVEKYLSALRDSIASFRAIHSIAWCVPLENELAEYLLEKSSVDELSDLLSMDLRLLSDDVSPKAIAIRQVLLGRIAAKQRDFSFALEQLVKGAGILSELGDPRVEEALAEIFWVACEVPGALQEIIRDRGHSFTYAFREGLEKLIEKMKFSTSLF